jgi:hypothetical protein
LRKKKDFSKDQTATSSWEDSTIQVLEKEALNAFFYSRDFIILLVTKKKQHHCPVRRHPLLHNTFFFCVSPRRSLLFKSYISIYVAKHIIMGLKRTITYSHFLLAQIFLVTCQYNSTDSSPYIFQTWRNRQHLPLKYPYRP